MAVKTEVSQYIARLAQQFGLDEKALLAKAESDAEAAKLIDEGVMLRSDYSRKQDELARMKADAEAIKSKNEQYYDTVWKPQWAEREKAVEQQKAELARYKAESAAYREVYGTLEGFKASADAGGNGNGNAPAANAWLDQKRYETDMQTNRMIAGLSGREFALATAKYSADIGGVMDVDAFDKFVNDGRYLNGVSVDEAPKAFRRAYDEFVRPKLEEKRQAQTEADVTRRIQEGVQAELAKRGPVPIDTSAPGYRGSYMFRQPESVDQQINDPQTPAHVREDLLRKEFMKDMDGATLTGAVTGR